MPVKSLEVKEMQYIRRSRKRHVDTKWVVRCRAWLNGEELTSKRCNVSKVHRHRLCDTLCVLQGCFVQLHSIRA